MSLATDILWHAFVTHAKQKQKPKQAPVTVKPKPAVTSVSNRGLHLARVPYCQRRDEMWQTRLMDGKRKITLGRFHTLQRAQIALRLYHLWKRRGFADIPTGSNHTQEIKNWMKTR